MGSVYEILFVNYSVQHHWQLVPVIFYPLTLVSSEHFIPFFSARRSTRGSLTLAPVLDFNHCVTRGGCTQAVALLKQSLFYEVK